MDYSLCIFKVDWKAYFSRRSENNDETFLMSMVQSRTQKLQHCYECLSERGLYYHIGLIDYLQMYNTSKVVEKYAKRVLKMDSKLDTSS